MRYLSIVTCYFVTSNELSRRPLSLFCLFNYVNYPGLQVYKSLDIVTAKVTMAERQAAPHHMLDVVDPLTNFSVMDFRDMALPIVIFHM